MNRHQLASMYRLEYNNVSDARIRTQLRKRGLPDTPEEFQRNREFLDKVKSGEFQYHQDDITLIGSAGQLAADLVNYFMARAWWVYDTPPILLTCDEPVIPVSGHGPERAIRGGLATAGVVLHPLSPSRLLVVFHPLLRPLGPPVLDHHETIDINREILANTHRWAFDQPKRRFAEKMPVPPLPPKTLLPEGPLQWDGEGDLYRYTKQTRWASCPNPPWWPVERWWNRLPRDTFPLPPIEIAGTPLK